MRIRFFLLTVVLFGCVAALAQDKDRETPTRPAKVFVDAGAAAAKTYKPLFDGDSLGKVCPQIEIVSSESGADFVVHVVHQAELESRGYEWTTVFGHNQLQEGAKTLDVAVKHSCLAISGMWSRQ